MRCDAWPLAAARESSEQKEIHLLRGQPLLAYVSTKQYQQSFFRQGWIIKFVTQNEKIVFVGHFHLTGAYRFGFKNTKRLKAERLFVAATLLILL